MSGVLGASVAPADADDAPAGADTALTALLRRRLGVLDDDEAAGLLGVQTSTLQRWRVDGKGPSYVKVGNRVLYREEDVAAWLAQRVEQTPEMKYAS